MGKLLELRGHGRKYLRMAVTDVQDGNAGGQIDIAPALHIPQLRVPRTVGKNLV
jgi:hypothetical protein